MSNIILDEDCILMEDEVLTEALKVIKSPSDIDASKTNVSAELEAYKNLLSSGGYREFKSSDKALLETALRQKEFMKTYGVALAAAVAASAGPGVAMTHKTNKATAQTKKDIDEFRKNNAQKDFIAKRAGLTSSSDIHQAQVESDLAKKKAKSQLIGGAVSTGLGVSSLLLSKLKAGKVNLSYTVFKYKGMTVISVLPKGGKITQTKKQLKNCYAVLVKTGKNEAVVLKKLKSIASKEA